MGHPPHLPGALDLSSAVPYNNRKVVGKTRLSPLLVVALVVKEEQLAAAVAAPALLQWQVVGLLCLPTPVRCNKDSNQS